MLIQCKITRKPHTVITMGGVEYTFAPREPGGPHVADVTDKKHIARFLSIPEGYCYVGPGEAPEPGAEGEDDESAMLDALNRVLDNPQTATREDAVMAHQLLEGRAPHGKAHLETILLRVVDGAVRDGYLASDLDEDIKAAVKTAHADS